MNRLPDLDRLYQLLQEGIDRHGRLRTLGADNVRQGLPAAGVYFFFEPGEYRASSIIPRVVRVGTHGVSEGSRSTLWQRLHAHRGHVRGAHAGGGNHRGSIFRRHLGTAFIARDHLTGFTHWGLGANASSEIRAEERELEQRVSAHLARFSFTWVPVPGASTAGNERSLVERSAIGLLSNYGRQGSAEAVDPPTPEWLGHYCSNERVRASGLWNVNHVDEQPEPGWLIRLAELIHSA